MINPATTNLADKDLADRLDKASFRGVNLAQHRLMRSSLRGLDLTGTNFEEADLTGADFTEAILDRANFTGATITQEQINAAKSAKEVILPSHLQPPPPPVQDPALLAEIERLKAELAAREQKEPQEPAKRTR